MIKKEDKDTIYLVFPSAGFFSLNEKGNWDFKKRMEVGLNCGPFRD